ncbi:hypothetical protein E4634_00285 [Mangrovimicrobium sediminis]|uniref:Uncharacterized protein n=1 Tax=Mangrovimicrobium sediminis TaxID=2562682 RepID=A0A4Z0M9G1_9GAMM|nr:hypothetical protein [Haliea sp. SAOS-164]TGD76026.1 hypothetical protein E4634_00285 [Haliea sp. SAOS-164]
MPACENTEVTMAKYETKSLSRNQFLTVAVNLLHKALVESPRTDAKNLFKALAQGKRVALTNVQMEDKSTVRFDLALDHTEFHGNFNYSAFRASTRTLMANIAAAVQEDKEVSTFGAENNEDKMIFGIPAVTMEEGQPTVMVLAADLGGRDASVLLHLMYLGHEQFQQAAADGAA